MLTTEIRWRIEQKRRYILKYVIYTIKWNLEDIKAALSYDIRRISDRIDNRMKDSFWDLDITVQSLQRQLKHEVQT